MELQKLKDSTSNKQSELNKEIEKLQVLKVSINTGNLRSKINKYLLQEKLKENHSMSHNGNDLEKVRLKSLLGETQQDLDQIKKEYEVIRDQMEHMRRENDELKRKLDDFEKVSKFQRNMNADSTAMDKEIRDLRIKLVSFQ